MKKCLFCCLFFIQAMFLFALIGNAATGGSGYAIYHANAFVVTYEWHSGIMCGSDINATNAIIHEGDADSNTLAHTGVNYCSKDTFLNLQPFRGYYRPVAGISSYGRDCVVQKAIQLTQYEIGYSLTHQLEYTNSVNSTKVEPQEITGIRCDGVVEYCNEYYNLKIYGTGDAATQWNISNKNTDRSVHSILNVSPKKQAEYYMTNMLGDIDSDNSVTSEDARLAMRFSVGSESPNSYQSFVADVDGNGQISSADSRLILRFSVGLETIFPADPINNILL